MTQQQKKFSTSFAEMRMGVYDDEATEKLALAVKAVRETGKKGAVGIVLAISPNDNGSIKIEVKIAAKVPEASAGAVIMYDDADGNLHRGDPKQMAMFPETAGRKIPASIEARANYDDKPIFDKGKVADAIVE